MFATFESTWITVFLLIVAAASVVSWWLDYRQSRAGRRREAMVRHPAGKALASARRMSGEGGYGPVLDAPEFRAQADKQRSYYFGDKS